MRPSTSDSCAAAHARARFPGLGSASSTRSPWLASPYPARSCATISWALSRPTSVPPPFPNTGRSETLARQLRSFLASLTCSQGRARPTSKTSSHSPSRLLRVGRPRRLSSRIYRLPPGCITSSTPRAIRSTWGRPRRCDRAWAATTPRARSGRRYSAWCPWPRVCAPIRPHRFSRRGSGSCATSRPSRRLTTPRRGVRDPSTGSSPRPAAPASFRPSRLTTYPAPSVLSARVRMRCVLPGQSNG